jgi:hypothetical protein
MSSHRGSLCNHEADYASHFSRLILVAIDNRSQQTGHVIFQPDE